MARRAKSSGAWLAEHFDDAYVKRAQQEGYRSRAAYKLQDLDRRDKLLRPGMRVVDLGAAPGGWSQYARRRVGDRGRVIAVDRLPMESVSGVECLQGDFTEPEVVAALMASLDGAKIDLVLSDMAPNITGIAATDQARAVGLGEAALAFAGQVLGPGGGLVIKTFQGPGFDELRKAIAREFKRVLVRKPQASRARSAEVYLVGVGFKGDPDGAGA
jgi:23S rRNA (uridine2552-2'-O)-methyltransferase